MRLKYSHLKYSTSEDKVKLAFSSSACPDFEFDKILNIASLLKFDGIEIKDIHGEPDLPNSKIFSDENFRQSQTLLKASNIEIVSLTVNNVLSDKKNNIKLITEAYEHIDLAHRIGIKYVKVSAEKREKPSLNRKPDMSFIFENLRQICMYAKPKEVTILIETNGFFSDSRLLARFLKSLNCQNCGVSWNINNTVRYSFETPVQTVGIFEDKIKIVQLNDSVDNNDIIEYKAMGRGDLPIKETIAALKNFGYNEYLSLTWPKKTNPEILPPETILPQFHGFLKNIM